MRQIVFLGIALLLLFGCLDLFRYSESTYSHTIGIIGGSARLCYMEVEEPMTFTYEFSSTVPVDIIIARESAVSFNETTGEPILEGLQTITKAYGMKSYSESVGLGEGTYIMILTSENTCAGNTITTNLAMNCV